MEKKCNCDKTCKCGCNEEKKFNCKDKKCKCNKK